jgi:hypothetical protein
MMEILAVIIGCFVVEIWLIVGLKRDLVRFIDMELQNLDTSLAQAIVEVTSSAGLREVDPPNPMQMMIMQLIQSRMPDHGLQEDRPGGSLPISRDSSGKFA